ncbi:MAG: hypothetical protein ACI9N9_002649 [Enterobacterales bacterium]|jgi:hypothetical protein
MMTSIRNNNKVWATLLIVVLGVIWLNIALLPCVHAAFGDNPITHNCPHCPIPQKDSCHDKNTCDNCDDGYNTLNVQKYNIEVEKNRANFFVPPLKSVNDYSIFPQLVDIQKTTYFCKNSIPIYLKNCAFLN